MGQSQTFGEGFGNQSRLIIAAFSLALPVERHRNDNIGRESVALPSHYFQKPLCEPRTQRLDLLECEKENCTDQRSLVDREAACAIKAICFVLADGAEARLSFFLL